MPLIVYACKAGHITKKLTRQAKDAPASFPCPAEDCYHEAKKQLSAPNSASKISIDNGVQARAVEINPDIVEINKARSEKNYRED
jgi:hypothetical protein